MISSHRAISQPSAAKQSPHPSVVSTSAARVPASDNIYIYLLESQSINLLVIATQQPPTNQTTKGLPTVSLCLLCWDR